VKGENGAIFLGVVDSSGKCLGSVYYEGSDMTEFKDFLKFTDQQKKEHVRDYFLQYP